MIRQTEIFPVSSGYFGEVPHQYGGRTDSTIRQNIPRYPSKHDRLFRQHTYEHNDEGIRRRKQIRNNLAGKPRWVLWPTIHERAFLRILTPLACGAAISLLAAQANPSVSGGKKRTLPAKESRAPKRNRDARRQPLQTASFT